MLSIGIKKCSFCLILCKKEQEFKNYHYLCIQNQTKRTLDSTNMKQPQRLTISSMYSALISANMQSDKFYFKDGFAIVIDINRFLEPFINLKGSPYLLDDYRLGIVKQGYIHGILNLQEFKVEAGSLIFITPGTIVEPLDMSEDFQVVGIGVPADMFHVAHNGQLPDLFNGQLKHGIQKVDEKATQLLNHMVLLLWDVATKLNSMEEQHDNTNREKNNQQVIYNMLSTITSYYNALFDIHQPSISTQRSANDIFDRFIYLVNAHCKEHRQLAFYAEKICITERYLGTVIRQASGITAKDWIDRAVITAAKVMLRYSNLQIAEIAERLHFPNPSFFCKYFKRLEGCTPQEYKYA